eukprot:1744426-Rhodomonas_salina.1
MVAQAFLARPAIRAEEAWLARAAGDAHALRRRLRVGGARQAAGGCARRAVRRGRARLALGLACCACEGAGGTGAACALAAGSALRLACSARGAGPAAWAGEASRARAVREDRSALAVRPRFAREVAGPLLDLEQHRQLLLHVLDLDSVGPRVVPQELALVALHREDLEQHALEVDELPRIALRLVAVRRRVCHVLGPRCEPQACAAFALQIELLALVLLRLERDERGSRKEMRAVAPRRCEYVKQNLNTCLQADETVLLVVPECAPAQILNRNACAHEGCVCQLIVLYAHPHRAGHTRVVSASIRVRVSQRAARARRGERGSEVCVALPQSLHCP